MFVCDGVLEQRQPASLSAAGMMEFWALFLIVGHGWSGRNNESDDDGV